MDTLLSRLLRGHGKKGEMKDIMLDIETLGTSFDAVIVQIGACYFNRTGDIGEKLSLNVSIKDCLDKRLKVDAGALKFWFAQKNISWTLNPLSLSEALQRLRDFVSKKALIWSHATFDIPIIANAYHVIGQKPPFSYRNTRDIRTLNDLARVERAKNHEKLKVHDALKDCIYQVSYCVQCFKKLGKI